MKLVIGGLIVVILLGLYVYSVQVALLTVSCATTPGCTAHPVAAFTSGFATTMGGIGGLVSALVVTVLALTDRGRAPSIQVLAAPDGVKPSTVLTVLSGVYVFVWLGYGLAAFIVGVMQHPEVLQPLTDLGAAWFGLALAAAYAYFQIKR